MSTEREADVFATRRSGGRNGVRLIRRRLASHVIGLDNTDIEAPFAAEHVGVSGNGCVAAYVVTSFAPPVVVAALPSAGLTRIATIDRCDPANSRVLTNAPTSEGPAGQPVLDFDGSTVVVPIRSRVVRFDIAAGVVETDMPVGSLPGFDPVVDEFGFDGSDYDQSGNSVDVSADGSVVVATLIEYCDCSTPVTVVVGWQAASPTVQVLSTVNGSPSGFAVSPSVSGDGRFVSFVSTTRLAGQNASQTGPWVYVRPRANPAFTLISEPGEEAYFSSLSEDGAQVAYMRTLPSCNGSVPVPGCVDDPDQLITVAWSPTPGLAGALQREDVNVAAGGVNSDHRSPVLSGNGRYVARGRRRAAPSCSAIPASPTTSRW